MSGASTEQIVGTIGGAVIGFFAGGPGGAVKGAYIGYGLGTAFTTFELDTLEGPRLDDRKIQTSDYGQFIPRVYNTEILTGNVFWVNGNKIKTTKNRETVEQGGKGGPSTEQDVVTYSYSATMAVGICEGPITGIRRIWADEVLIYDISDETSLLNLTGSAKYGGLIQVFFGTDGQEPSTIIEAEKGTGNVPAFRGLAYVVFTSFELEKYGNRIPNFRFEVVDNNVEDATQSNFTNLSSLIGGLTITSVPAGYPIDNGSNTGYARASYPYLYQDGVFHNLNWSSQSNSSQHGSAVACYDDPGNPFVGCDTTIWDMPFNYFTSKGPDNLSTDDYDGIELFDSLPWDIPGGVYDYKDLQCCSIDNSPHMFLIGYQSIKEYPKYYYALGLRLGNGKIRYYRLEPESPTNSTSQIMASYRNGYLYLYANSATVFTGYNDHLFVFDVSSLFWGLDAGYYDKAGGFDENNYLNNLLKPLRSTGVDFATNGACWGIDPYGDTLFVIDAIKDEIYSYDEELNLLQTTSTTGLFVTPYAFPFSSLSYRMVVRGQFIHFSQYNSDESAYYVRKWLIGGAGITEYEANFLTGSGAGLVRNSIIDINYYMFLMTSIKHPSSGGGTYGTFLISIMPLLPSSTGTTIQDVVSSEMSRIDVLDSNDYDVSGLTNDTVRGYLVNSPGAISSILKPLQQGFRFDAYEEDYQIKFRTRGTTSSRVTITGDDLRAHEINNIAPPELLHKYGNPNSIPGRVEIIYKSSDRDNEAGFAYADRLTLDREAVTKLELPLVMNANEAYQTAEILLLDAEREGKGIYEIVTNYKYSHLVKTDIITVSTDLGVLTLRIIDIEKGEPGLVKIVAVEESTSDYSSSSVGESGDWPTQTVPSYSPSSFWFLDIPQLRAGDDNPGVYWGMSPLGSSSTWEGGTLYKSQDNGTSWDLIDTTIVELEHGVVGVATDGSSYTIFTYDNPITVSMKNGVPETKTETQVRNGANTALYGKPGAWEIIKFITATSLGNDQYELNGILRGQFGTDWAMDMHTQGDLFIILDKNAMRRLDMTEFNYSTPNLYLPISIGLEFNDTYKSGNISSSVAKIPHAPEHVKGYRASDGALTIAWTPRGRYNFQWANAVGQPNTDTDVFEIEVMNGSTVVRTITSVAGTHSVEYSAADQTTDFGSTQNSLTVRVYQQSDLVTRGYPREATI